MNDIKEKKICYFKKNSDIESFLTNHINCLLNVGVKQQEIVLISEIKFEKLSSYYVSSHIEKKKLITTGELNSKIIKIYEDKNPWFEQKPSEFVKIIKLLKSVGKKTKELEEDSVLFEIYSEYEKWKESKKKEDIYDQISSGLNLIPELQSLIVFVSKFEWPKFKALNIKEYISGIIDRFSHIKNLLIITDIENKKYDFGIKMHDLDELKFKEKKFIKVEEDQLSRDFLIKKGGKEKTSLLLVNDYLSVFIKGQIQDFSLINLPLLIKKKEFKELLFFSSFALNHPKKYYDDQPFKVIVDFLDLSRKSSDIVLQEAKKNGIKCVINDLWKEKEKWKTKIGAEDYEKLIKFRQKHKKIKKLVTECEKLEMQSAPSTKVFFKIIVDSYGLCKSAKNESALEECIDWLDFEFFKFFNVDSEMCEFKSAIDYLFYLINYKKDESKFLIADIYSVVWWYMPQTNIFAPKWLIKNLTNKFQEN